MPGAARIEKNLGDALGMVRGFTRRGGGEDRRGGADIFQVTRERFPRLRPRRNIPSLPSLSGEGLRFSTIW